MTIKVTYQGAPGAYSEQAAAQFFRRRLSFLPVQDFAAAFRKVKNDAAKYAVLPIENSLTGSIHQNYDLLAKHRVWICGEIRLAIRHALIGQRQAKLNDLKKVYSHPQALWQCQRSLSKLKRIHSIPFFDTAGAVAFVKAQKDPSLAAVASKAAAKTYHLKVLANDIQDTDQNFTRFIVICKQAQSAPKLRPKTSLLFTLKSVPGALYRCLGVFAEQNIQLLKIESRPLANTPFEYRFYLDFRGSAYSPQSKTALQNLKRFAKGIQNLGIYTQST